MPENARRLQLSNAARAPAGRTSPVPICVHPRSLCASSNSRYRCVCRRLTTTVQISSARCAESSASTRILLRISTLHTNHGVSSPSPYARMAFLSPPPVSSSPLRSSLITTRPSSRSCVRRYASTCSAWWCTFTTISRIPAPHSMSNCHCSRGFPASGSSAFGWCSVNGFRRVPSPAANIIAFIVVAALCGLVQHEYPENALGGVAP